MNELLSVKNLTKKEILNNVSFSIKEGEMVAIMGPSGSGKSTLLYNAAGMDSPDDGEIWLRNTEITNLSEDEKASLRLNRMGFVFQNMNVMSNLNILDNILLPSLDANKKRNRKKDAEEKALSLMKKLSISGLEKRKVTEVSGGQLQRACICRSMINNPEILFADEPTGALNQSAAIEVMKELSNLNKEGTTILLVTHDSKVALFCNRILYLLDGKICGELEFKEDEENKEEKLKLWLKEMEW